jgi:imidazolonepropionase-like amidohydrolase
LLPGLIDLHTDLTGDARQYSLYVETPLVRNLADGPDEVTKAVRTNLKNGAVLSKGITPGSGPGRSVRLHMRDSAARLPRAFR